MARSLSKPTTARGSRFGHAEPARETVAPDGNHGSTAWLEGEAINMTPEQLLEYARERMRERDALIEKLLKHLPRKFEDRIKALSRPKREAENALHAVEILLGNLRLTLESPGHDYEEGT